MDFALSISEVQERVSDLIIKLVNRAGYIRNKPQEEFAQQFSTNLIRQAYIARQREGIEEELVESLINLFALAGMLGVDLERRIYETILLLEMANSCVG